MSKGLLKKTNKPQTKLRSHWSRSSPCLMDGSQGLGKGRVPSKASSDGQKSWLECPGHPCRFSEKYLLGAMASPSFPTSGPPVLLFINPVGCPAALLDRQAVRTLPRRCGGSSPSLEAGVCLGMQGSQSPCKAVLCPNPVLLPPGPKCDCGRTCCFSFPSRSPVARCLPAISASSAPPSTAWCIALALPGLLSQPWQDQVTALGAEGGWGWCMQLSSFPIMGTFADFTSFALVSLEH